MNRRLLMGAAAVFVAIALSSGCSDSGGDDSSANVEDTAGNKDVAGVAGADNGDVASSSDPTASDGGVYTPDIAPGDFVTGIDHPFFPMSPGNAWVYEGVTEDGLERVEVAVQDETRVVMGVPAVVVRDKVTVNGELVEDTYDWFAQDKDGNVWYLGEDVRNYEDGEYVDSDGAWEAGVDGALPGVIMWATPGPDGAYRQEYLAGQAEDMARVIQLDGEAAVPFGSFSDVLVTEEWTPLEPGVAERKHYVRGVGLVLEEFVKGGRGRMELVRMTATE